MCYEALLVLEKEVLVAVELLEIVKILERMSFCHWRSTFWQVPYLKHYCQHQKTQLIALIHLEAILRQNFVVFRWRCLGERQAEADDYFC